MIRRSASETAKRFRARRDFALDRLELRQPSVPRVSADSPMSFPVKAEDGMTRQLIEDFRSKRASRYCPWCQVDHDPGMCKSLISGGQSD